MVGTMHLMEGRHGSEIYPSVSEIFLRPFGQAAGTSWTHNYSKTISKDIFDICQNTFLNFVEDYAIIIIKYYNYDS